MIEPVLYWNHVALEANRRDHTGQMQAVNQRGPTKSARALAMVHVAIYDTLAEMTDTGYKPVVKTPKMVWQKVKAIDDRVVLALSAAARCVLQALYPAQATEFKQQFDSIRLGCSSDSDAEQFGEKIAERVLKWRENEQCEEAPAGDSDEFYKGKKDIFPHKADPFNTLQGLDGKEFGRTSHFLLPRGNEHTRHLHMTGLTDLYGSLYKEHFKRVAERGAKTSACRTTNEKLAGIFWAYDGVTDIGTPPRLYNQIAVQVLGQQCPCTGSTERTLYLAHSLMMINGAMADAGVEAWYHKFAFNLARPVVAIREAGAQCVTESIDQYARPRPPVAAMRGSDAQHADDSVDRHADPFWEPLGAPNSNSGNRDFTPPFPAYPSGHATFGAAAFEMLRRICDVAPDQPDNIGFCFVSDEFNGFSRDSTGAVRPKVAREFKSLADAMFENGLSRVYLGVHWQFDATSADSAEAMLGTNDGIGGIPLGRTIAQRIFEHYKKA